MRSCLNQNQLNMKIICALFVLVISAFQLQAQHSVTLKSGEIMSGTVISINDGVLKFDFKGNKMDLKLSTVKSINFVDNTTGAAVNSGTKGVSYVMAGRKMVKEPKIDNLTMEKGIVVVEVTINKYGNVIKAEPGIEGSTTTSNYLLTKAKQAAESVMFDTSPVMPQSQTGTITITF